MEILPRWFDTPVIKVAARNVAQADGSPSSAEIIPPRANEALRHELSVVKLEVEVMQINQSCPVRSRVRVSAPVRGVLPFSRHFLPLPSTAQALSYGDAVAESRN